MARSDPLAAALGPQPLRRRVAGLAGGGLEVSLGQSRTLDDDFDPQPLTEPAAGLLVGV